MISAGSAARDVLFAAERLGASEGGAVELVALVDDAVGRGVPLEALAAAVDDACASGSGVPLAVSGVARAAVLSCSRWSSLVGDGDIPWSWRSAVTQLMASIGGSGDEGLAVVRATSTMGDGGRIALAGVLNPAMQSPSMPELWWHPELRYPPLAGLAMYHSDCTLQQVGDLGWVFDRSEEDPAWVVAALLGDRAVIPWPEWEPVFAFIGRESPVGTINLWIWLLERIGGIALAPVFGQAPEWLDLPLWTHVAGDALEMLCDDIEYAPDTQATNFVTLAALIEQQQWPPAQHST